MFYTKEHHLIILDKFLENISSCENYWKGEYTACILLRPTYKPNEDAVNDYIYFCENAWKHHSEVLALMKKDFQLRYQLLVSKYNLNMAEECSLLIGFFRILKQKKVVFKNKNGRTLKTDISVYCNETVSSDIATKFPAWLDSYFNKQDKKIRRRIDKANLNNETIQRIKEERRFNRFLAKTEKISSKNLSDNHLGFNL